MSEKDRGGLYSSAFRKYAPESLVLEAGEVLPQQGSDYSFGMNCNGYFLLRDGSWEFSPYMTKPFIEEFKPQSTSFFGPGGSDLFFSSRDVGINLFRTAFDQRPVTDVIGKYRRIDEDLATRVAFLLGGVIRNSAGKGFYPNDIADKVRFVARMAMLGEQKSADALTSAMAMYTISDGRIEDDRQFTGNVYEMTEAVRDDPIDPQETRDLGISQVARLRKFVAKKLGAKAQKFPEISEPLRAFEDFPTVGAEFHFPPEAQNRYPNFLQRLALLNMSQYQKDSSIQLSRNDRDVIEVRMNPSIYPVTIANWNHMRLILPELNRAYFTITINRLNENFQWDAKDKKLLNDLRAIGLLTYAGVFGNAPKMTNPEEVDFGAVYLGQTVRVNNGKYKFEGNWSGKEGLFGQMSIYAGFGDTLPYLSYYLSMVLANPDILKPADKYLLNHIRTLRDALEVSPDYGECFYKSLQDQVSKDEGLNTAFCAGKEIENALNP